MKPGPDMNVLVAEKVMGWKTPILGTAYIGKVDHYYAMVHGMQKDAYYEDVLDSPNVGPGKTHIPKRVPPYSTDIAAAWDLVEKLGLLVVPLHEAWLDIPEDEFREPVQIGWAAGRGSWHGPTEIYMETPTRNWMKSETAPHAICLAALKAVGVEVPA